MGIINLSDSESRTVEIEVTGLRHDLARTSHYTLKVDYSGWNKAIQQIGRTGGKIAKVTVLSSPLDTAKSHLASRATEAIAPQPDISHAADSASVTLPDEPAVPAPATAAPETATADRSTQTSKSKKTSQSTKAKKTRKSKSSGS